MGRRGREGEGKAREGEGTAREGREGDGEDGRGREGTVHPPPQCSLAVGATGYNYDLASIRLSFDSYSTEIRPQWLRQCELNVL